MDNLTLGNFPGVPGKREHGGKELESYSSEMYRRGLNDRKIEYDSLKVSLDENVLMEIILDRNGRNKKAAKEIIEAIKASATRVIKICPADKKEGSNVAK